MKERIATLKEELKRRRIDCLLVSDIVNIRYLSGFTGSAAQLLVSKDGAWLFTDSRYTLQAKDETEGVKVRRYTKEAEDIAAFVKKRGFENIGLDGRTLSYERWMAFKKRLDGVRVRNITGIVERARARKDEGELDRIKRAIKIAERGFRRVEATGVVGRAERDVAWAIESVVRKAGAERLSFDIIVASGERSALPHGMPSQKKIARGEFLIVDMGVVYGGYSSDETRTYFTGRKPDSTHLRLYTTVLDAQRRAIEAIKAGVAAKKIDGIARSTIRKAGYGRYFGHGTGHGVGLKVHEAPYLGPRSPDVLEEGMVVTVEPGIYVPGLGGVRIEDMVFVEKDGCTLLTMGNKELRTIE